MGNFCQGIVVWIAQQARPYLGPERQFFLSGLWLHQAKAIKTENPAQHSFGQKKVLWRCCPATAQYVQGVWHLVVPRFCRLAMLELQEDEVTRFL